MEMFEEAARLQQEAALRRGLAAQEWARRVDEVVGEAVRYLVETRATSVPAYAGESSPRLLGRGREVARAWPIGAIAFPHEPLVGPAAGHCGIVLFDDGSARCYVEVVVDKPTSRALSTYSLARNLPASGSAQVHTDRESPSVRNVGATAVFRGSGSDVLDGLGADGARCDEQGRVVATLQVYEPTEQHFFRTVSVPWEEHLSGLVAAYALANGRG